MADAPSDPIAFFIVCKLLIMNLLPCPSIRSSESLGTASNGRHSPDAGSRCKIRCSRSRYRSVGARSCATGTHVRGSYFPIGDRALPPVKPQGAGSCFRSSARDHRRSVAFRAGRQRPHDRTRFPPNRLALLGIVPLLTANLETVKQAIFLSHN